MYAPARHPRPQHRADKHPREVRNDGVLKLCGFGSARSAVGGSYETVHTQLDLPAHSLLRWYKPSELMLGFLKLRVVMYVWALG